MKKAKEYIKNNVFSIENRYGVHTVVYDEEVTKAIEIAYLEGKLENELHPLNISGWKKEINKLLE